ncbi:MAG: septum site-determining protein MinC [Christensenellales bacterium]|jgi:septum site-determining protein MinC
MRDIVAFKGKQSSLEIEIASDADFSDALKAISERLEAKRSFFAGSACVNIVGGSLDEEQQKELATMLKRDFGMLTVDFESAKRSKSRLSRTSRIQKEETHPVSELKSDVLSKKVGAAVFVRETVRNGQRIDFDGDIVVCGDVNFGAELVATGNIAVMGALRGKAHAGSLGDETAVVTAYRLAPQQLRIGGIIAIAPSNAQQVSYPEIARVVGDTIVIAPASRVIK